VKVPSAYAKSPSSGAYHVNLTVTVFLIADGLLATFIDIVTVAVLLDSFFKVIAPVWSIVATSEDTPDIE
jgi:hypothetical protein